MIFSQRDIQEKLTGLETQKFSVWNESLESFDVSLLMALKHFTFSRKRTKYALQINNLWNQASNFVEET